MQVKTLRIQHNWSQEQLATMSGLSVRTIQRIEKGESVGLETLKSLAAVFEIDVNDLKTENIVNTEIILQAEQTEQTDQQENEQQKKKTAIEKIQSIKQFYFICAGVLLIFSLFVLPNYNGGENLGPLIVVAISFALMLGVYAISVFEPFGDKWQKKKLKKILDEK
jgi:transcriptional regulator with XRE-family HTH domain